MIEISLVSVFWSGKRVVILIRFSPPVSLKLAVKLPIASAVTRISSSLFSMATVPAGLVLPEILMAAVLTAAWSRGSLSVSLLSTAGVGLAGATCAEGVPAAEAASLADRLANRRPERVAP